MKRVLFLWLGLSVAFLLIGYQIDWRSYISRFGNIPDLFEQIRFAYSELLSNTPTIADFATSVVADSGLLTLLRTFFEWLGSFFVALGQSIANFFVFFVKVPYYFVNYVFQLLICVLGFNSIKTL